MDISTYTRKDIGNLGERVAAEYLRRQGFELIDRNVARKTGEIDIIVRKEDTLHFVEVKTIVCMEFPHEKETKDTYDPSVNLHPLKIRKVARTAEWYVVNADWEGEWQIDGVLIWLRKRDGMARASYFPQLL
jgi:putative endonuclease